MQTTTMPHTRLKNKNTSEKLKYENLRLTSFAVVITCRAIIEINASIMHALVKILIKLLLLKNVLAKAMTAEAIVIVMLCFVSAYLRLSKRRS